MKEFVFYYDVICPYAYLASRLIEGLAENVGAKIRWRPVLLGGIYKATKQKEQQATKAYETMNPAKRLVLGKDLMRLYRRHNVPAMPFKSMPDLSTLKPMRLLAACEDENGEKRKNLTHRLYHALWAEKKDISDESILQSEVAKLDWDVDVAAVVNGVDPSGKEILFENTNEAVKRGAFGVPSFWVNNRLYFGCDRLHFLEKELGKIDASPYRLVSSPQQPLTKRKLRIFHDFASPWCFIAQRRISSLLESVSPMQVEVEWVPILLGALFNAIGSPQVPMSREGEAKIKYVMDDFGEWCKYLSINNFKFPSGFPHKSLMALRMTIANSKDELRTAVYESAWTKDLDIGNSEVLAEVVKSAGCDPEELFSAARSQEIKDKLRENTERAISLGLCGVPSFQVDDQPVIWGQDRLNIIADELCGWQDDTDQIVSRL
ncbi:uncharacterized protein LOC135684423 [Rhopilema esculentum]|uniref:uncharacterized protein LOC135684423 n=1 Tax=Rhopilema esculentum TaxID=499914 RepID=UPI0031DEC199